MNKPIFVFLLIILSSAIWGQNLIVNTYEEESYFVLSIPFSQFFFSVETPSTQYQLSINIIDSKKKNVYQKSQNLTINKESIPENSAYVIDFPLVLESGQYRMVTLLRNLRLGDKKERQFDFAVQAALEAQNTNLLIAENSEMKFLPSAYKHLSEALTSCFLILDSTMECDSIIVKAKIDNETRNFGVLRDSGYKYDLLPVLNSGNLTDLELRCYDGNTAKVYKGFLYQSNDRYNQYYSSKDQLQQIKYIANQNEWKVLSKIAQKDTEAAIEYFWERHDNSPGTLLNELRELFTERVLKADELFTIHKKIPGWRSDRGRIFIRKGPPDDIV
ncbi:MAG: GWxTD domain-containing protein, partial [Candidatus Cloacimonadaceae bacterium]